MNMSALSEKLKKSSVTRYLKTGTRFSSRFFTAVLVLMGMLLVVLAAYDHRAEQVIKNLRERYIAIEQFRNEIINLDEALSMSARMAAATGDIKWEKRY